MLDQKVIHGFSFGSPNPLWEATLLLIDASIEVEISYALSKEQKGEDRAYHAGRAQALTDFKNILLQTRDTVLQDQGRPPE